MRGVFRTLGKVIRRVRRVYELNSYDDFTIAEYFRRQGADIGEHTRISLRSLGTEPWLIKVGDHCSISAGVRLVTHDGSTWVFTTELPSLQKFGPIEIRNNCYIGVDAVILPGVTIGPNSIVGAGAVVTKDVPPDTIAAGVPARPLRDIDSYRQELIKTWSVQRPEGYMTDLREGVFHPPAVIQRHKAKDNNRKLLREHLVKMFRDR